MKWYVAQAIYAVLLLMMLASIGLQVSGYMEGRLSTIYDQTNKLHPEINKLESAANSIFDKGYPLDLDRTNYHELKALLAELEEQKRSEREFKQHLDRIADASFYTIVPYAIFSLAFILTVGRNGTRLVRPISYGFAFAALMCIAVFCYLYQVPPGCVDLECLYSLLTISSSILVSGLIVTTVTSMVMRADKGPG